MRRTKTEFEKLLNRTDSEHELFVHQLPLSIAEYQKYKDLQNESLEASKAFNNICEKNWSECVTFVPYICDKRKEKERKEKEAKEIYENERREAEDNMLKTQDACSNYAKNLVRKYKEIYPELQKRMRHYFWD